MVCETGLTLHTENQGFMLNFEKTRVSSQLNINEQIFLFCALKLGLYYLFFSETTLTLLFWQIGCICSLNFNMNTMSRAQRLNIQPRDLFWDFQTEIVNHWADGTFTDSTEIMTYANEDERDTEFSALTVSPTDLLLSELECSLIMSEENEEDQREKLYAEEEEIRIAALEQTRMVEELTREDRRWEIDVRIGELLDTLAGLRPQAAALLINAPNLEHDLGCDAQNCPDCYSKRLYLANQELTRLLRELTIVMAKI